jgi:hypothetical protein
MAVRHGIEAAGINRASHRQKFVQESTVATLIEAPTQAIGRARVSRAGFGVSPKQFLGKSAIANTRDACPTQNRTQHQPLVGNAVSHSSFVIRHSSFVIRHFSRIQVAE